MNNSLKSEKGGFVLNNKTDLCKGDREKLLKMIEKKYKSPLFKKCDKITDFKKQTKCFKEQDIKYKKTPLGKKHVNLEKKLKECDEKEIERKGCSKLKEDLRIIAVKQSKNMTKYFKLMDKMKKKCDKLESEKEKKKCAKSFAKELKYFEKPEIKKIEKEYTLAYNKFYKCLNKE